MSQCILVTAPDRYKTTLYLRQKRLLFYGDCQEAQGLPPLLEVNESREMSDTNHSQDCSTFNLDE